MNRFHEAPSGLVDDLGQAEEDGVDDWSGVTTPPELVDGGHGYATMTWLKRFSRVLVKVFANPVAELGGMTL